MAALDFASTATASQIPANVQFCQRRGLFMARNVCHQRPVAAIVNKLSLLMAPLIKKKLRHECGKSARQQPDPRIFPEDMPSDCDYQCHSDQTHHYGGQTRKMQQ